MKKSTIAIIGAGTVGSTTAFTLMMRNLVSKILLVDVNDMKCKGEAEDLSDALSFSESSEIIVGTLAEAGQADIVIISAGVAQKPGQSRMELLKTNYSIIASIINNMKPLNPDLIIIMVTNPVDILTYIGQKISGLPYNQIFGSGTLLDTQRLRHSISKEVNIAQQSIHLYVLGEHGDSQFVTWSTANIAQIPLQNFKQLQDVNLASLAQQARMKAYNIIECKGSTAFGIAACVSAYCQNIIFDTKRVTPVSCYSKEYDICLSMPAVLGSQGIEQILTPVLSSQEKKLLEESAKILKNYCTQLAI